mgnify:CR=1 FL=1
MMINLFQSTLPREERHYGKRGITVCEEFQSTLPREERQNFKYACSITHLFQSTLPREERQWSAIRRKLFVDFNPRSHERSDKGYEFSADSYSISIHAPTRGATKCIHHVYNLYPFQSTLPREERRANDASKEFYSRFQSTLPREERQQYCTKNLFIFIQYRQ